MSGLPIFGVHERALSVALTLSRRPRMRMLGIDFTMRRFHSWHPAALTQQMRSQLFSRAIFATNGFFKPTSARDLTRVHDFSKRFPQPFFLPSVFCDTRSVQFSFASEIWRTWSSPSARPANRSSLPLMRPSATWSMFLRLASASKLSAWKWKAASRTRPPAGKN